MSNPRISFADVDSNVGKNFINDIAKADYTLIDTHTSESGKVWLMWEALTGEMVATRPKPFVGSPALIKHPTSQEYEVKKDQVINFSRKNGKVKVNTGASPALPALPPADYHTADPATKALYNATPGADGNHHPK